MTLDPSTLVAGDELLTTDDYLMESVRLLRRLVDLNTPGVPGIRGAQEVPELTIERHALVSGARFYVPGNRRRQSLSIQNIAPAVTIYVMDDAGDSIAQGFPIGPYETVTITARAALWLESDAGAAEVAVIEVSS